MEARWAAGAQTEFGVLWLAVSFVLVLKVFYLPQAAFSSPPAG